MRILNSNEIRVLGRITGIYIYKTTTYQIKYLEIIRQKLYLII